jgi:hypothetical protein
VYNLRTLLEAAGVVGTDGVLPSQVSQLILQSDSSNGSASIRVGGSSLTSTTGFVLSSGDAFGLGPMNLNILSTAAVYVMPSSNNLKLNVCMVTR